MLPTFICDTYEVFINAKNCHDMLSTSMTTTPIQREIDRRRTFAIISHPDAGKTTLTEKLLLYGGAIHTAGAVKSKKAAKSATSDWMSIEKERGISVASSVMQFEYAGCRFNLLDTPGHNDFSEDTYRTLTAADCAVMLVDIAKGVEPQTIKLFQVCKTRGIPIVTFVNKMDRDGREPMEVLDEIENVLGIPTTPVNYPVGMGKQFRGVFDLASKKLFQFDKTASQGAKQAEAIEVDLHGSEVASWIGEAGQAELIESLELIQEAGNPFSMNAFLAGEISPVFFGSAMNNFGIGPFLEKFYQLCPAPRPRPTELGEHDPHASPFSGFVFKIQANMDPKHRDRIAFVRICSGKFERGMKALNTRSGRKISMDRSLNFFASERINIEEAYSGDILGLWDSGHLRIGDTISEKKDIKFVGMPTFSPEIFVRIRLADPMKRKQLMKGLEQLSDEGAVQLLNHYDKSRVEPILGAVGWLQIEVVKHRLQAEYNVNAEIERLPYQEARWIFGEGFDPKNIVRPGSVACLRDLEDRPLILFDNKWTRFRVEEKLKDGFDFVAAVQPGRKQ